MEGITTPETLPDGSQLNPADGGGADQTGSISLAQLSDILGKDFKDVDGALKSIKDTYGYVGSQAKYTEKISALASSLGTDEQGVLSTIETLMEEINNGSSEGTVPQTVAPQGDYVTKEDLFFMKNENLADLRDVLTPIKNSNEATRDMPWDQFVGTDTAKKILEPIAGYREVQNQRSVLDSSPRLGSAIDRVTQARTAAQEAQQALRTGDVVGSNNAMNVARESAVSSVIDAYGLDK